MNKKIATALTLAGLLASNTSAANEESYYLGVGLTAMQYKEDFPVGSLEASLPTIMLRGGFQYNEILGAELRLGHGVGEDDDSVAGVRVKDISLEHVVGLFVTAQTPLNEIIDVYAMIGYSDIEVEAKSGGSDLEGSGDSFSHGAGMDVNMHKDLTLNFEITSYYDHDDAVFLGFNFGVSHQF